MEKEKATVIQKSASALGEFGSATGGVLLGGFLGLKMPEIEALKKIPGVGDWIAKLTPGALLVLIAYMGSTRVKNEYGQHALMGVGIAGVLDMLRRSGLLAKINSAAETGLKGLRGLKGNMGIVQNFGAYSPDYFLKSNWATRPLNGPDARAFSLQGPKEQSFSLQGPKEQSFSLQGGIGCMFQ